MVTWIIGYEIHANQLSGARWCFLPLNTSRSKAWRSRRAARSRMCKGLTAGKGRKRAAAGTQKVVQERRIVQRVQPRMELRVPLRGRDVALPAQGLRRIASGMPSGG